ncbi:MAG TPA: class II aldolase/adducin family protein [Edaphobacter sp.]|nr:class II aldolase/adducin family protein [Edaphobacter sp.]
MSRYLTEEPIHVHVTSKDLAAEVSPLEMDLRREMARIGRWMHRAGYTPGTAGNLSVRLDRQSILASPTGCSKSMLKPMDFVIIDLDGHKLAGLRNVTSEIGMHLTAYRMRPDVQAIVHSHPPIATAFAACRKALDQPICSEIMMTTGLVPLARYATTGTSEVGDSLKPLLLDHDAILLANHGLLTCGETLIDAFMKTETVEHFAQVCLAAEQMGGGTRLEAVDIEKLKLARARYKRNITKPCDF